MVLFVDTSAWMALLDDHEAEHAQVKGLYQDSVQAGSSLVTTSAVMGELYTLAVSRRNKIAHDFRRVLAFVRQSPSITVAHVTTSLIDDAWTLLFERPDKSYSFIDATSFAFMYAQKIDTALTLDRHFAQEGFNVLPRDPKMFHDPAGEYQTGDGAPERPAHPHSNE